MLPLPFPSPLYKANQLQVILREHGDFTGLDCFEGASNLHMITRTAFLEV